MRLTRLRQWSAILLATVLLFGPLLSSVAQAELINGLVAKVEDELGNPLTNGMVSVYEQANYPMYQEHGAPSNYADVARIYSDSLSGGEFFIPRAYLLEGREYEIVVQGISNQGQNIYYHSTFIGGQYDQLRFTKDKLKKVTLSVDNNFMITQFSFNLLSPTGRNLSFNNPIYIPNLTLSMYASSASRFVVHGTMADPEARIGYQVRKEFELDSSSSSVEISLTDDNFVKLTPPVNSQHGLLAGGYFVKELYVSKNQPVNVQYAYQGEDFRYIIDAPIRAYDKDQQVSFQFGQFVGKVYYNQRYGANEHVIYTSYQDEYNNYLAYVARNPSEMSIQGLVDYSNTFYAKIEGSESPVALRAVSGSAGVTYEEVNISNSQGNTILDYQLLSEQGRVLQSLSADYIYNVVATPIPSGRYTLKLTKQHFPENEIKVSMDNSFSVSESNPSSVMEYKLRPPEGYGFYYNSISSSFMNASIREISQNGETFSVGLSPYDGGLRIYGTINHESTYRLQLALHLTENGSTDRVTYYNTLEYTGEQLQKLTEITLPNNLNRVELRVQGISGLLAGGLSLNAYPTGFVIPGEAKYLLPTGTYSAKFNGIGTSGEAYELPTYRIDVDKSDSINLDYSESFSRLVPVQLKSGDSVVPFITYNIKSESSPNYEVGGNFSPIFMPRFTKLMTIPENNVKYEFVQIDNEPNETPWLYRYSTDWLNNSEGLELELSKTIQASEIVIQQYPSAPEDRTNLLIDVPLRSGDLFLTGVAVYREYSSEYGLAAAIEQREYNGSFLSQKTVYATATILDAQKNTVFKTDISNFRSAYLHTMLEPGDYTLTFQLPVGPGKEIKASKSFTVLPVSTTPSKPEIALNQVAGGLEVALKTGTGTKYYEVFAAEKGKTLQKVAEIPSYASHYIIEGIEPGKTYQVKVVAVGYTGERTESDVKEYAVPVFGVASLNAEYQLSQAGLLKIDGDMKLQMTATIGDGYKGFVEVSYVENGSEKSVPIQLKLDSSKQYTGHYTIPEGVTEIKSFKGYVEKPTGEKSEGSVKSIGLKVGATVSGNVTRGTQNIAGATIAIGTVKATSDSNGAFTIEGAPAESKITVYYENDKFYDLAPGFLTKLGTTVKQDLKLPVLKDVVIQFVDQDTGNPVSKKLSVSIRGNETTYNRDGRIGDKGLFALYSGETTLEKVRAGSYAVYVKGEGIYKESKHQMVIEAGSRNYVNEPVKIQVEKKTKQLTNLNLKFLLPDSSEATVLDYYSLSSSKVGEAFGWDLASHYGYGKTLTVSERVYGSDIPLTNAVYVPGSVIGDVYYNVASIQVPNVILSDDYYFYTQIKGQRTIYSSELKLDAATNQAIIVVDPGVKVHGSVLTTDQRLLAGADVSAYTNNGYAYTKTDSDGKFTLTGLPENTDVDIYINHPDYLPATMKAATGSTVSIVLEPSQYIEGRVLTQAGQPILHAYVSAYNKQLGYSGFARTDSEGYFKIRGLKAGSYDLTVNGAGYPTVTAKHNAGTEQVTIRLGEIKGSFTGEGNSFVGSVSTVIPGKTMDYRVDYKNNGTQAKNNVNIDVTLDNGLTVVPKSGMLNGAEVAVAGKSFTVPVGTVAAGQSGSLTFQVQVSESADGVLVSNTKIDESALSVTTNVLFISVQAPAQTADKRIKVYGNAKPGTTVEILVDGIGIAQVKADKRWWFADVTLPVVDSSNAGNYTLVAKVTDPLTLATHTSQPVTVNYNPKIPKVSDVTVTAGWNGDVKLNPYTGVATFAVVEKTPLEAKVIFEQAVKEAKISFLGQTYTMTSSDRGITFSGGVPAGWSSYGEQLLELTFTTQDDIQVTLPLMEIIVLIDPSGYVFEGSMSNRVQGITAVVEEEQSGIWTPWDAERFGQVNPQVTDENGRYGWDVIQGNWRVLFSKPGYESYISRVVEVPPAETQLNVPMIRNTAPVVESITPADKAAQVTSDTDIRIVFDRPMKEDNLNAAIKLYQVTGGQRTEVAGSLVKQGMKGYKEDTTKGKVNLVDGNGQTGWFIEDATKLLSKEVTFKPNAALAASTTYELVISEAVEDYDGKLLTDKVTSQFTTAAAQTTTRPIGGGGGGASPAGADEVQVGTNDITRAVKGNEVLLSLPEGKTGFVISEDAWKIVQSKGYSLNVEKDGSMVTVPAAALKLGFNESLRLSIKQADVAKQAGYTVAGAAITVDVVRIKNGGQTEEIIPSEPVHLKLKQGQVKDASLIGIYEIENGQPIYLGRSKETDITGSGTYSLMTYSKDFEDVQSHWAKGDVDFLISHHIVNGVTDQSFEPDSPTTRAQVAKLLVELAGIDASAAVNSSFKDVDANAWYASYVAAAEKAGLFQGADGVFRPDDSISREELAVVITRMLEVDSSVQAGDLSFADQANISAWAAQNVAIAVELGIIQGDEANRFNPSSNATRAESAAMIRRLIQTLDSSK
jgi:uncharacterized repeat protein (TIGR01451 family)